MNRGYNIRTYEMLDFGYYLTQVLLSFILFSPFTQVLFFAAFLLINRRLHELPGRNLRPDMRGVLCREDMPGFAGIAFSEFLGLSKALLFYIAAQWTASECYRSSALRAAATASSAV